MRIEIKNLKWIFLALYFIILTGLLLLSYLVGSERFPFWIPVFDLQGKPFVTVLILAATLLSQVLFIFGTGRVNLCRPVKKRRLIIPVFIASLMLTVLAGSFMLSMYELLRINSWKWLEFPRDEVTFFTILGINWVVWAVFFFFKLGKVPSYNAVGSLFSFLGSASLLQLLVAIAAHAVVSRRGGCLVGIMTGIGLSAAVTVMLWSFGPGVLFLFLRERYLTEKNTVKSPDAPAR